MKARKIMFLLFLALAIIIGVSENIKDSYDAYKYHQQHPYNPSEDWWKRK